MKIVLHIFANPLIAANMSRYTIYFNNSAIYIGSDCDSIEDARHVTILNSQQLKSFIDAFLATSNESNICLDGMPAKDLVAELKSSFSYIEAGGGLVVNENKEYLFIKRFDIWDLPKGKLHKKENPKEGALREVIEETAVKGLENLGKLPSTYHIYPLDKKYILKKTHWYLFQSKSTTKLHPQHEEAITEVVWLNQEESLKAINESYRSLRDTFIEIIRV